MTNKKKEHDTLSLLQTIIEAIKEKKGEKITEINLQDIDNAICDYFVICQGNSNTQVGAIVDSVQRKLKKELKLTPFHVEGKANSLWVLMDYGEILVHVFIEETRLFYNLEDLWADGKISEHNED